MKHITRTVICLVLLICWSNLTGQYSIKQIMTNALEVVDFSTPFEYDSIVFASSFRFNLLMSGHEDEAPKRHRLFYKSGKLVRMDSISDQLSEKIKYSAYFFHTDTLVYYVKIPRDTSNQPYYYRHFGVVNKTDSLNLLFAFHRDIEPIYIDSISEIRLTNIPVYYGFPFSVFILDQNLKPQYRLFFNGGELLSHSLCHVYDSHVREFIHAQRKCETRRLIRGSYISNIQMRTLSNMRKITVAFGGSVIIAHTFDIEPYFFIWEYHTQMVTYR